MKALFNEIRMYTCECILGLVLSLAPNNQDGHLIVTIIRDYFQSKVNSQK